MSSTKLIVLKSREIIYTAILIALIAIFIIIMVCMFRRRGDEDKAARTVTTSAGVTSSKSSDIHYNPGTYKAALNLAESTVTVSVTVDDSYITGVSLEHADEVVTTMYPLLEDALLDINTQLHYVASVDDITPSDDSSYTTMLIVSAIRTALEGATLN